MNNRDFNAGHENASRPPGGDYAKFHEGQSARRHEDALYADMRDASYSGDGFRPAPLTPGGAGDPFGPLCASTAFFSIFGLLSLAGILGGHRSLNEILGWLFLMIGGSTGVAAIAAARNRKRNSP